VGYHYQVLSPVVENPIVLSRQMGGPMGSSGNADGFQDVGIPQENPEARNEVPVGQKRSAMSAAPGTPCRGRNPVHCASALDFSPTHFIEPQSDVPISQEDAPSTHHDLTSPAHSMTRMSTPISQNPLLQTRRHNSTSHTHTPSPMSSQSRRYR
jgi:hypothetical protein